MTLKQIQRLSLWSAALALALVAIVPLAIGWRVLCVMTIVSLLALTWRRMARRKGQQNALLLANGSSLPPASYPQPVLLVCGDGLGGLFGSIPDEHLALRVTDLGCYVRVPCVDRLQGFAVQILAKRPEWGGQLSAMLVVDTCAQSDSAVLAGQVRRFNNQVAMVRKRGIGLPVVVMCYLQTLSEGWFSWEAGHPRPVVREAGDCVSLSEWQQQAEGSVQAARLATCVQLQSAAQCHGNEQRRSPLAKSRQGPALAITAPFVAGLRKCLAAIRTRGTTGGLQSASTVYGDAIGCAAAKVAATVA